ncbi:hypothetical protein ACIRQP_25100 [Streptomyces sp. NPDC102274]|uniref:hypothetical protein n=1 Tax=Streptomyces sp. NPDC102274 TaxID=3366151 RepID=UPI00380E2E1E
MKRQILTAEHQVFRATVRTATIRTWYAREREAFGRPPSALQHHRIVPFSSSS